MYTHSVLQELVDSLETLVPKAQLVPPVALDPMVSPVSPEALEAPEPLDSLVPLELLVLDSPVLLVPTVSLDLQETLAHPASKAHRVPLVHKDLRVTPAPPGRPDPVVARDVRLLLTSAKVTMVGVSTAV